MNNIHIQRKGIRRLVALPVCLFALLFLGTACDSDFLKEYSQDLARVQSYDDLNEILIGNAYLQPGLVANAGYYITINNTNYMMLHFMSDELEENLTPAGDVDRNNAGYRGSMFPYFCWQQAVYLNYDKKDAYESGEVWYWDNAYKCIATCNMVISEADKLSPSNEEEEVKRDKVKGESYFLRALYYDLLVNLYADPYAPSTASSKPGVPIKTSEYIEDKDYTRNSVSEVYNQIVSDLNEAETYLKDVHKPKSIHHAGINAVYLLHSRVALYMQDWENALKYAQLSLQENSTLTDIAGADSIDGFISPDNEEVFFSMGGTCLGNVIFTRPGETYYGTNYSPTWKISDHLYNLYADNDSRKKVFFGTEYGDGNEPYYKKIDISYRNLGQYKGVSDQFIYRSAEAYLNAAEAEAQLGNDAEACRYLNQLRANRIKDAENVSLTGDDLIKFIRQERERELCFDGVRWFDMRRYAVDTKCPEVETVEHTYTTTAMVSYQYTKQNTMYYQLKTDDGGMTLDIPKSARDFQNSLGSNQRPLRNPVRTVSYN